MLVGVDHGRGPSRFSGCCRAGLSVRRDGTGLNRTIRTIAYAGACGALALGGAAFAGAAGKNGSSGDVAAKVKAAAEAKVPNGTVERVETDADHGSPYEAQVRKADGTELEVLVDKDFSVTAVSEMMHR